MSQYLLNQNTAIVLAWPSVKTQTNLCALLNLAAQFKRFTDNWKTSSDGKRDRICLENRNC